MKFLLLAYIVFVAVSGFTQTSYYSDPLKIQLNLSASFGELRSNHFHSGIDIKTKGTTGLPVNSVAGGFISRIAVSPTGFGRALYIDHPNGTTSVYAHLKSFRDDIEEYVKNEQYKQQSFRVDLQVPPKMFEVVQDEIVAYSGNSGSSGGPHLHFEIRDTKTQEPLNPLQFNFTVADKTPPKIFSLMVVPLDKYAHAGYSSKKQKHQVVFYDGQFHLAKNPTIPVFGNVGFAIQTNDYFDNSYNKCGIFTLNLKIDGELYYSFTMDRFAFHETRFLNSHIDYSELKTSGAKYIKTWKDPGNELRIYDYVREDGKYFFKDGNIHHVKIELTDTHGNFSQLSFKVKSEYKNISQAEKEYDAVFEHNKKNTFYADGVQLEVPNGALYENTGFQHSVAGGTNFLSPVHVVHTDKTPLHKPAELKIKTSLPKEFREKAMMVKIDPKTGKFNAFGGEFKNGWVSASIREFGNYAVTVDTITPIIIPLSIRNSSELTESNRIRFKISDELSGIAKIEGFLDGKWALFEYDAKSHIIAHYFDPERFDLKQRHEFLLSVTDYRDNTKTYEASFWK